MFICHANECDRHRFNKKKTIFKSTKPIPMSFFKKLFGEKNNTNNKKEESNAPDPESISTGGSNVYNYSTKDSETEWHLPNQECVYMDEIIGHLEMHIGNPATVFHEIISDYVHIDVHWIKPSAEYPFNILVTTGMSDLPMSMPAGMENVERYNHAELMVVLPADWPIGDEEFKEANNYWPVYFLKMIARFPHEYKTWIGYGHTIPNGQNAEPIANTGFGCILTLPPMLTFPEEFLTLETKDGTIINFLATIPLYEEEMNLKLEEGTDALLDRFDEFEISEVIDIDRPNVAL
ncbi:MAG: hypothetical protein DI598_03920 [Pseudopedobacter saltans]|uniref:Suppressor of fused-like domain-containing protein n=1 Tax=Pseudopedobacter saltans TaxID=151895 RepID=A0A2W5F4T8_9SPHI|nr:MAG: hypothetical protein DI598_03920 [Pseudopedobacter saltans]